MDPESVLEQGASMLEWAASAQRAGMQREFDAADPVPGVAELRRLAAKLRAASSLRGDQLETALAEVSDEELATIRRWEEGAAGPSFHTDTAETVTRRQFADTLRAVRELMELPWLRRRAGEAFYSYEQAYVNHIADQPGSKLDAGELVEVLGTGDEDKLRAFINEMRQRRDNILP